ncbi:hypothetical protein HSRCO_1776 [Halanaeroarchaeum sp. HSR-CO]|uniref:helix-turn-helix domain-containing protein n=1 Tax=Halanaeroarchaeum sp. HSR-CO TaxID=2866382 RepID=UPI00217F1413|nr:helix-turn-helix domain-containing protein [Halanaeroarchaeum sp. HSR-CO]UWG48053.1 hypothetical protein HSRCO_1776 [Halanaeroarchaeum sp. HSR-CO]
MSWKDSDPQPLARTALDTLPLRIAVIDNDGVIVETNRGWREFAAEQGISDPAMIGTPYFDAGGEDDLESYQGIRHVLAGDQDLFVHEYPCETAAGKRWYMMRVAPFVREQERFGTVAHIDITNRKRQEQRRNALLVRIEGLITDISVLLSGADNPDIVLRELPGILITVDGYRVGWTARRNLADTRIETIGTAGPTSIRAGQTLPLDPSEEPSPGVKALLDGQPIEVAVDPSGDGPAPSIPVEEPISREIAVPIRFHDVTYGLLGVFTDDRIVFQEQEREVLSAIASLVGQGLASLEQRHLLSGASGVALTFTGRVPDSPLIALWNSLDIDFQVVDLTDRVEGSEFIIQIPDGTFEDVQERVHSLETISEKTLIQTGDSTLVGVEMVDPVLESIKPEPAVIESYRVTSGELRCRLLVESRRQARSVYDRVTDEWPDLELLAIAEREPRPASEQPFQDRITSQLTDRQSQAIRLATHSGYFDADRTVDGETLASAMDVTRQTFHQHLRAAQAKIFGELFQGDADGLALLDF